MRTGDSEHAGGGPVLPVVRREEGGSWTRSVRELTPPGAAPSYRTYPVYSTLHGGSSVHKYIYPFYQTCVNTVAELVRAG